MKESFDPFTGGGGGNSSGFAGVLYAVLSAFKVLAHVVTIALDPTPPFP